MPEVEIVTPPTGPDAPPATPPAAPARPEGLPEKFGTVGDLAKAYTELEKKLGSTPPAEKPPEAPPATPPTGDTIEAKAIAAGLDLKALAKEYVDNAKALTPETKAKLVAQGIPEEAIATYVAAAEANASAIVSAITQVAGGEQGVQRVLEWAKANLSEAEIAAYDGIMDKADPAQSKLAFEGIFARYQSATGIDPSAVTGSSAPVGGVKPFGSQYEMTQAMSDPRYKNGDAVFQAEVYARMAVTNVSTLR